MYIYTKLQKSYIISIALILLIPLLNTTYAQTEETIIDSKGLKVTLKDGVLTGNLTNAYILLHLDNQGLSFTICEKCPFLDSK